MKKYILFLFLLVHITGFAQFTLDKNIKPIPLELKENTAKKEAKGIVATNALATGKSEYYTVKGHDLFQFIDVYVFTLDTTEELLVDIVTDNWATANKSKNTKNEPEGIVNFKFRTVGNFGIKITNNSTKKTNYSVVVSATPPVKSYLNSPFRTLTEKDKIPASTSTNQVANTTDDSNTATTNSQTLLYIIIGLLAGIIIMLALRKKKSTINMLLLLLSLSLFSKTIYAQNGLSTAQLYTLGNMLDDKEGKKYMENMVREQMQQNGETSATDFRRGLDKFNSVASDIQGKLSTATHVYNSAKELYDSYENLSSCINSAPLPGLPKVPSFCVDNNCKNCFLDAREQFNQLRYKFEKLQAIYNCTKRFSKAAIAFGDNASGIHAVTGMAWQVERIKIEKSVISLDKAYVKKRAQFLRELQNTLQQMDTCEAQFGLPDWYDRFGYLIYDFIEMRYHK